MRLSTTFLTAFAIVPLVNAWWSIESYTGKSFTGNPERYEIGFDCVTTSGQLRHNTLSLRTATFWTCYGYYDDHCQNLWDHIDSAGWRNIGELQISSMRCSLDA
jgi:hypothetical protein